MVGLAGAPPRSIRSPTWSLTTPFTCRARGDPQERSCREAAGAGPRGPPPMSGPSRRASSCRRRRLLDQILALLVDLARARRLRVDAMCGSSRAWCAGARGEGRHAARVARGGASALLESAAAVERIVAALRRSASTSCSRADVRGGGSEACAAALTAASGRSCSCRRSPLRRRPSAFRQVGDLVAISTVSRR